MSELLYLTDLVRYTGNHDTTHHEEEGLDAAWLLLLRMIMVVRVRRTVRSFLKGSAWHGTRKLSMRGQAKVPFLLILRAAMRQRCAGEGAPSTIGSWSW